MRLHLACGSSLQSLNDVLCSIIRKLFRLSVQPPCLVAVLAGGSASALVWFDSLNAQSVSEICGGLIGCASGKFCRSLHEDTYKIIMGYEKE